MTTIRNVPLVLVALGCGILSACDPDVPPEADPAPVADAAEGAGESPGGDEPDSEPAGACDEPNAPPDQPPGGDGDLCSVERFEQDARILTLAAAASEVRAQIPFVLEYPAECAAGADLAGAQGALYEAGLSVVTGLEQDASTLEPTDLVPLDTTDLHIKRLELYRRSFERDLAVLSCNEGALWSIECTQILTNQWVCIPTTDEDLQDLRAADDCDCPWHWKGQCLCDEDHSTD